MPCLTPTATKLPCCVDPARCVAGQQLCPSSPYTPAPSPAPSKLPCCVDPSRCVAGQTPCPSQTPLANCCAPGANCNATIPACSPYPSPAINNTTQCCDTADCFNATGFPPCGGKPTTNPSPSLAPSPSDRPTPSAVPSPSDRPTPSAVPSPSDRPTPSAVPSPSDRPSPSEEPSPKPSERVLPSEEPSQKPSERPEPSQPATVRPEPSQPATVRPEPSPVTTLLPEPSQPATVRPEPSQAPTIRPQASPPVTPRPTFSAKPSVNGPSAPPTVRPSRLPAASLMLPPVRRSAAPTPWPARPSVSPLANIGVLNSAFRFNNANASKIAEPEKLQQVTANIACALRLPLENIVIRNITQTRADGTVVTVPFDPQVVSLNSNGTVVCYTNGLNTTGRVLRGARRLVGDSSVAIEYSIIDPSPALLTMDSGAFATTVESDPAINNIASALDSDGVIAEAPPELSLMAAAPSDPAAPPAGDASSSGKLPVGPITAGVVGAFIVGGVIVGAVFMFMTRKPKISQVPKRAPATMVIIQNSTPTIENPLVAQTPRQTFDPVQARTNLSGGARV